ncbi:MAG: GNAT family N-acetyltransferase [Geminicoccaceae bacterium]|nr:GNAT family N-acetyltransferase [Geminicoccaceae bacterium]
MGENFRVPAQGVAARTYRGRYVRLEPIDVPRHAAQIFAAGHGTPKAERIWDYMPYGPFADEAAMAEWLEGRARSADPLFCGVIDARDDTAKGMLSWLRITPEHGVIEVGHIWYAEALQKTPAPTEAMLLLFTHVFDELGYRRLEWKCNAANEASRSAALRFGFTFEGVFRQHMVIKGRNRDTAWFSILDHEWPALRAAMQAWLAPENFDGSGRQRRSLAAFR